MGVAGENAIARICNSDMRWRGVVKDKIVFAAMMKGLGFPVVELVAFHHPTRRCFMARDLATRDDLAAFLRGLDRPVFGKPAGSRWSLGASSLSGYDAATDSMTTLGGECFPVGDLVDQVAAFAGDGYLFQERLEPHPAIAAACGPAMGTVRLLTATGSSGPELLAVAWKVVGGGNVADNFWRRGNMLAAVDAATGAVVRVASGLGHESVTHELHPDTGAPLVGFVLPFWDEVRRLCLEASTALVGLRLIGWDVVLTAGGPVIVEANTLPAYNLHQIATGRGVLHDRFAAFVEACRRDNRSSARRGLL